MIIRHSGNESMWNKKQKYKKHKIYRIGKKSCDILQKNLQSDVQNISDYRHHFHELCLNDLSVTDLIFNARVKIVNLRN